MPGLSRPRAVLFSLVALPLALLLALACGGDGEGGNGDEGPGEPVTFDISMLDEPDFSFEPVEVTVAAGQEVTFNVTNDGAAIHNMRIAGEDNQYNTADDAVSDLVINAGQSSTVTWTAPDEPGVYSFVCDYHQPGMAGSITVEG